MGNMIKRLNTQLMPHRDKIFYGFITVITALLITYLILTWPWPIL